MDSPLCAESLPDAVNASLASCFCSLDTIPYHQWYHGLPVGVGVGVGAGVGTGVGTGHGA